MRTDDFFNILFVYKLIPDGFRINHHDRAVQASPETASLIDPYHARLIELQFGNARLGVFEDIGCAVIVAGDIAIGALIAANKDMMFEVAHEQIRKEYVEDYRGEPDATGQPRRRSVQTRKMSVR